MVDIEDSEDMISSGNMVTVNSDDESNISDHESEMPSARRGRPPVLPDLVLVAADKLFARAKSPQTISMDAIATAAGVGKGTLFRAFGSRDGLLDALWAKKLAPLRKAFALDDRSGESSLPPGDRAIAFMDALLDFKLENRHLLRARELAPGLLQSEQYQWMHALLHDLIEAAAGCKSSAEAAYAAHALLSMLHIDLIEALLFTGMSRQEIRHAQGNFVQAMIGG